MNELDKIDHIDVLNAENGTLLDVIQPNGKRLGDCTGTEVGQIGEWFVAVGEYIERQRKV
jgi:hypothetical protein